MAERVDRARCPGCDWDLFRYIDTNPDGEYPAIRLECGQCLKRWRYDELTGITYPEVPF